MKKENHLREWRLELGALAFSLLNLETINFSLVCRRINSEETWQSVEDYLWERVDVKVSHGCCPDCLSKLSRQLGEG